MVTQWPPEIPPRLRRQLEPFTFYRDGVMRWYRDRAVHVCGKRVPLDQIEDIWTAKKKEIDGQISGVIVAAVPGDGISVADALSRFYEWLDHRVETGQPKRLSAATRVDYERKLTLFAKLRVPAAGARIVERVLAEIGPEEFGAFAKTFSGQAPASLTNAVAYVRAFFEWCKDEGLIEELPRWGRYFVKPPAQDRRDVRLKQRKSYRPSDIQRLFFHASLEEKAWIGFGINGAFDNGDLANLTFECIDRKTGVIDFRRRKKGLMPRLIPVHTELWELLDLYLQVRPNPAEDQYADRVFLTPTGLPLGRAARSKAGKPHWIDYVTGCWTKLLRRAGFRNPVRILWACSGCGDERTSMGCKCGKNDWHRRQVAGPQEGGRDGKGYRALRTTFSNLAPRGYKEEVELVMGHAGGIRLENYLEEYGEQWIRELIDHVWAKAFSPETPSPQMGAFSAPSGAAWGPAPVSEARKGGRPRRLPSAREGTP